MSTIDRLSRLIAEKISITLDLDIDKQEVLVYGAFSILQTFWSIGLVMIFGLLFDVFWEAIVISTSGALLRKYSGGAHATSPNRCAIIGAIVSVGFALILNRLLDYIDVQYTYQFSAITFGISYYTVYKYSPVDSPNKPIVREEQIKRLRKASFKMIHFFVIIIGIIYIFYLRQQDDVLLITILSICTGIMWQGITLHPLGHNLIAKIDTLLKNGISSWR